MIINLVLFFIPKRQEIYRLYLIKKRKKLACMRLNSKTMHSKIVKVKNVSIPTIGYAETMINKPQNTVFVGINNFGKINPASPINIALSDYDGTVYIFGLPGTNIDWIEIICLFCN